METRKDRKFNCLKTLEHQKNNIKDKDDENKAITKKLQEIQSIKPHESIINCVSIFPSGKIISASSDKSIIFYIRNNYQYIKDYKLNDNRTLNKLI